MLAGGVDPALEYSRMLRRAGRRAVPTLARELRLGRRAAAEAFGATGALVLAGLARHQGRRARASNAAQAVLDKYARPADVDAPDLAVAAHLARPRLDPRLGGLLGDAGERAARWLSGRTGAPPEVLGRALAACAPIALGALSRAAAPGDLPGLLATVPLDALETPERLLARGPVADAFRSGRRARGSVLDLVLGR